jgi:hypothetical protein
MATKQSAVVGLVALGAFAFGMCDPGAAQGNKDDNLGADVSSQCAQMKDPGLKDECVRRLRRESGLGSERSWQDSSPGKGASPGIDMGSGAGIGMGSGQGKGRK